MSAASGQGPRSFASIIDASSTWARICLKILRFQLLAIAPFERQAARLEEGVEAHHAEADAALALGAEYLARAISSGARAI